MKIKKGKLNYDQSGRAYPDNPRLKENWDSIWEYEGKYYKLVGDDEHKEWDEVNIYNQIIDEAYMNYLENFYKLSDSKKWMKEIFYYDGSSNHHVYLKKEFINKCKTDTAFSKKWGLKIKERGLSLGERGELFRKEDPNKSVNDFAPNGMEVQSLNHQLNTRYNNANIPTKLITITYNNETIESYE